MSLRVFTIGFAETSAKEFFTLLKRSGARRVVDVRLNNTSQLAGFSKRDDLQFFLKEVCGMEYVHVPDLAPTQDILDDFKKHKGSWSVYEQEFNNLMAKRSIEASVAKDLLDQGCLLCSEKKPHQCHRRLVVEYLRRHWGELESTHLG